MTDTQLEALKQQFNDLEHEVANGASGADWNGAPDSVIEFCIRYPHNYQKEVQGVEKTTDIQTFAEAVERCKADGRSPIAIERYVDGVLMYTWSPYYGNKDHLAWDVKSVLQL